MTSMNESVNQKLSFKNYDRTIMINSPKKKKRKHSSDNQQDEITSVHIIDRVIDFSKYNNNTDLYLLARDWMHASESIGACNFNRSNKSSQFLTNDNNNNNQNVYSLPKPLIKAKLEPDLDDYCKKSFDFNLDQIECENENLLKENLKKWKSVRNEQLNFVKKENERYKESFDLLKSIYENI